MKPGKSGMKNSNWNIGVSLPNWRVKNNFAVCKNTYWLRHFVAAMTSGASMGVVSAGIDPLGSQFILFELILLELKYLLSRHFRERVLNDNNFLALGPQKALVCSPYAWEILHLVWLRAVIFQHFQSTKLSCTRWLTRSFKVVPQCQLPIGSWSNVLEHYFTSPWSYVLEQFWNS